MTEAQSAAAKKRYARDAEAICPTCKGKGRILSESVRTRARQGGNAAYLASLKPGGRPMGQRNQGAKPMPTIEDLRRGDYRGGRMGRRSAQVIRNSGVKAVSGSVAEPG